MALVWSVTGCSASGPAHSPFGGGEIPNTSGPAADSTSGDQTTVEPDETSGNPNTDPIPADSSSGVASDTSGPSCDDCPPGCDVDQDCGDDLRCDPATNECVACLADADCPLGTLCEAHSCAPGCSPDHGCGVGLACCGDQCVDVQTDLDHCGACEAPCAPADASGACEGGECSIAECDAGHVDCNGATNDGCEVVGTCECTPGEVNPCYTGALGTEGVGVCSGGTQACNAQGTGLGACTGQTLASSEICGNGLDDDCDAVVDEDPDLDGDGWSQCGGDCCDEIGVACFDPQYVNPGAFEYDGNLVDDDCDGLVDNVAAPCDAGLASNSADPADYARAIDLCQFTESDPDDPVDRTWGVISAGLSLADGFSGPSPNSHALRPGFGADLVPHAGSRLAVLSTGHAADVDDASPAFAAFQPGQYMGTISLPPFDWLAANGLAMPNAPGCPAIDSLNAYNSVMLTAQIRVPTNARSFSVRMYFFSSEYPEYVCSTYNDFVVALVTSSAANPADGNIAVFDDGVDQWPIGVNILAAADGLFTQCANGDEPCGLFGYDGCVGATELAGTGFGADPNGCGNVGGATGWLTMTGNVTPGEILTLRFAIWDTGDELLDSLVLLDDFQWAVDASAPGVAPG